MTVAPTEEICFVNITRAGRRRRLRIGVALIVTALGAIVALRIAAAPRAVAIVVAVLLVTPGATSVFQATQNT